MAHAGGRPTKMNKLVIGKLEESFAFGATDAEACYYANINTDTLYEYQKSHPEFTERKNRLKQRPLLLARQTVVNAMVNDPALAMKYLEKKTAGEFSTRTVLVGPDGKQPINQTNITAIQQNNETQNINITAIAGNEIMQALAAFAELNADVEANGSDAKFQ
jgi:hypothetical protein